jgi:predicted ABC-type ATPase
MVQSSPEKQSSADKPVFFLLAGPNGAGKSTLYKALVLAGTIPATAEFVNADVHESEQLHHIPDPALRSERARIWADARRSQLLDLGDPFVSETVFSHPSKLTLIADAQAKGFFVMLLVVALDDTAQLLARVAQRVREGGHAVPQQRILERYPRTLAHLSKAVRRADAALLYDTSATASESLLAVALCKGTWTQKLVSPLPVWAQRVLRSNQHR